MNIWVSIIIYDIINFINKNKNNIHVDLNQGERRKLCKCQFQLASFTMTVTMFSLVLFLLTCIVDDRHLCDGIFPLRMPEVRPTRNETYLCTGVEIGRTGR